MCVGERECMRKKQSKSNRARPLSSKLQFFANALWMLTIVFFCASEAWSSCVHVFVYVSILFKDQGKQEICKNSCFVVARLGLFMENAKTITMPTDRLQPLETRSHLGHVFRTHVLPRTHKIQELQTHNFLHLAHLAFLSKLKSSIEIRQTQDRNVQHLQFC